MKELEKINKLNKAIDYFNRGCKLLLDNFKDDSEIMVFTTTYIKLNMLLLPYAIKKTSSAYINDKFNNIVKDLKKELNNDSH